MIFTHDYYCNTISEKCEFLQLGYGDLPYCIKFKIDLLQRSTGSPINMKCEECTAHNVIFAVIF